MKTFEQYLKENFVNNVIDHSMGVNVNNGEVSFYIHPTGVDGETLDFVVKGNKLFAKTFQHR